MIFVRLDENVSHKIAEAAEAVGIVKQVCFETPYSMNETALTDVDWVARFAARGKARDLKIAFSGDGKMRDNEAERVALESAGITVFFAPGKGYWRYDLQRSGQAAYLFRWLPTMVEIAKGAPRGAQFKMPGSFAIRKDLRALPRIASKIVSRPGRPKGKRGTPLLDS